jgi:hypothetical protein
LSVTSRQRPFHRALRDILLPLTTPIHLSPTSPTDTSATETLTELLVPKGTTLHIGITEANTREDIWGSDAKVWRPERWLEEGVGKKGERLPGVFANMCVLRAFLERQYVDADGLGVGCRFWVDREDVSVHSLLRVHYRL